jgi:molecular chaperone DnaK
LNLPLKHHYDAPPVIKAPKERSLMTVIQFRKRPIANTDASKSSEPVLIPPPAGVRAVGIDLGTTNSVVSVYTPGKPEPETLLYDDLPLVPSIFFFDAETNSEVVGEKARKLLSEDAYRVVRGTKRSMGSLAQNFFSGEQAYSPEDAAVLVLKHLAAHPELQKEKDNHGGIWAVITVPAHFDDAARQATIQAATRAGISVLRIVNEPTAAALAYSMLSDVRNVEHENLAVFDFGGGTFDVSIVERNGLVFNVLSSEGDVYLGGDDIDAAIAQHLLEQVKPLFTARRTKPDSPLYKTMLKIAEDAKIFLEGSGTFQIDQQNISEQGVHLNTKFNREQLDTLAAPFVQRTLELTERAMHAARRRATEVSRILLVGGSTRLSLVRKMLQEYFPASNVDARLEPDLAISWGAAVQAAIILGIEPNTILVDVCSHSLGIGVADDPAAVNENFKKLARKYGVLPTSESRIEEALGDRLEEFNRELQGSLRVAPIIYRNSPLPARRSEFFSTLYQHQTAVHVVVVQGEGDTVGENRLIGSFLFELEQPCPKGSRCEIQLTYDANGMVHVLAKQIDTENESEAQFDSRTGEVIGWRRLHHTQQESDDYQNTRAALFGADAASHGDYSHNNFASPAVLNGIIARARRFLSTASPKGKLAKKMLPLLETYEKLLDDARNGLENDKEIEFVETRLMSLLEESETQ